MRAFRTIVPSSPLLSVLLSSVMGVLVACEEDSSGNEGWRYRGTPDAKTDTAEQTPPEDTGWPPRDTAETADSDGGEEPPPETPYCRSESIFPAEIVYPDEDINPENTEPELVWKQRLDDVTPFDEEKYDYQEVTSLAFDGDLQPRENDRDVESLAVRTANPNRPEGISGFVRTVIVDFDRGPGNRRAHGWGYGSPRRVQTSNLPPIHLVEERHTTVSGLASTHPSSDSSNEQFLSLDQNRFRDDRQQTALTKVSDVSDSEMELPGATHTAVAPGGVVAALWNRERIVGISHDQLGTPDEAPASQTSSSWSVDREELWEGAPESVRLDWMRMVAPRTIVVRARDYGENPAPDRLYRLNPCRPSERAEVLRERGIGPEALKISDGYILRVGERQPGLASEPVYVRDGTIRSRLGERCRGLVQTSTEGDGEFVCASSDEGVTWYEFGPSMEDPYIEGALALVSDVRFELIGRPGPAMTFLGVEEEEGRNRIVVSIRYQIGWRHVSVPAASTPVEEPPPTLSEAPAVLSDDGELVFAAEAGGTRWLFGVETHLDGLYGSRYPRVSRGGNHGRGWTRVRR